MLSGSCGIDAKQTFCFEEDCKRNLKFWVREATEHSNLSELFYECLEDKISERNTDDEGRLVKFQREV